MFRKIVSQLSFSPALVGQLSFYAKRLKKEQATRRLGLVFVALALVVQSLVVFQAPQSANAANANDMIPGGLGFGSSRSLNNFVGPYDRNERNLKDTMDYFGISRNEIIAAQFTHFSVGNKIVWGNENRSGSTAVPITNGAGAQVTTLFGRPLNTNNGVNDQIYGYVGYSNKIGWFAIMQVCGNLVTDIYPSPPPPPAPTPPPVPTPPPPAPEPTPASVTLNKTAINVSRGNVDATKTTAKINDKITFKLTAKNTGGTAKNITFKDDLSNTLRFSKLTNRDGGAFNASTGVLSWPAISVGPGATVTKTITVQMNGSLETNETNCKIVNHFTTAATVIIPVGCTPPPANITLSKTATNVSQNNVDATKVSAKVNQTITFKLSAKNTGGTAKNVTFSDDLSSTLRYAKIAKNGGGNYNSATEVLSWPAVSVAPGATVTKSFSVKMNSSLESTETNCKIVNHFTTATTVIIPVGCTLPPAHITLLKTATNNSRGNVDATKTTAKINDKITFKLTAKNTGGTTKSIDFTDDLTSTLTFAKLTSNGGGTFNEKTRTLSWMGVNVAPGATITKTFTVQMNNSLETTQTNCKIMNSFADSNTVIVPVGCTPPPANIVLKKTAKNVSQNNVDAIKTTAKAGNKISFTLTAKNTGGTAKNVTFSDNLTSTLRFASLSNDGGGTLDTKTKVLTWPAVSVKPGATITKTFTVQMNSSLENAQTNCKIINSFSSSSTVTVPVGCTLPPAEIVLSKSAKNVTHGNIDATSQVAKAKDQITFTLVAENKGGSPKSVTFEDMIGDTLEYSKLSDNGGGVYNASTRTLAWPAVTLKAGAKEIRTFTIQILAAIPSTPAGVSDPSSYDCRIENVFGTDVVINVDCPSPKAVEQVVTELPQTGASENMIFAGIVLSIVTFFYFRSKQLSTEVRLIRRDLNGGTI